MNDPRWLFNGHEWVLAPDQQDNNNINNNITSFHKFINERLRDDLQKRLFALDTEIQERLQSMKIEIPNSIIHALEVTPVVEISTAKKRLEGFWYLGRPIQRRRLQHRPILS